MRIYVAGPMRGQPLFGWPMFEEAGEHLRAIGHTPVLPTDIDEQLGVAEVVRNQNGRVVEVRLTDRYNFEVVMRRDLEAVRACDAIVLLPGWPQSEGARLEYAEAERRGLDVFYGLGQVTRASAPVLGEFPHPTSEEVRVVDPETGGAKGSKPCQLFSAPPAGLEALGRVCGMGADKYELHNYRRGYAWSLSANAMLRHYLAWNAGEDLDAESGLPHLAHAAWHLLVLIQFAADGVGMDDRHVS